jgi:hypothetical protein
VPYGWVNDAGFVRRRRNGDDITGSVGTTWVAVNADLAAFEKLRGPTFSAKQVTTCHLCSLCLLHNDIACMHGPEIVHADCRIAAVGAMKPLWEMYFAEMTRRIQAERDQKHIARRRTKRDRCGEWIAKGSVTSFSEKKPTHYECRDAPRRSRSATGAGTDAP